MQAYTTVPMQAYFHRLIYSDVLLSYHSHVEFGRHKGVDFKVCVNMNVAELLVNKDVYTST